MGGSCFCWPYEPLPTTAFLGGRVPTLPYPHKNSRLLGALVALTNWRKLLLLAVTSLNSRLLILVYCTTPTTPLAGLPAARLSRDPGQ